MHKSSVSTSVVKNIWQFPSVSSLAHFLWVSTYYKYIPINLEVFLNCRGSMALAHKYSLKFKTSSSDTCWWWLTNFHSKLLPDVWRILRQPLFRNLIRSHFWTKLKWNESYVKRINVVATFLKKFSCVSGIVVIETAASPCSHF